MSDFIKNFIKNVAGKALAHTFTVGGVTTVALSGDQITTIIGGVTAIIGALAEFYASWKEARKVAAAPVAA